MQGSRIFMKNSLLVLVILMVARFSCIVLSNVPFMSMGYMFVYGLVFSVLFIMGVHCLSKREFIALMVLIIYVACVVFITVASPQEIFNTQAFNAYILFFLYMIYLFVGRLENSKARVVWTTTLMGFLFTYIYSVTQLIQDPLLSRKAAASVSAEEGVDMLGAVGGFDTVYGSIFVICILLFMLKQTRSKVQEMFLGVVLVSSCVFVVMSSYGIAIMLLVLLVILWLVQKKRLLRNAVVVIGITCLVFHEQIGTLISDFSEYITYSNMLEEKIDQIGMILSTGESAGTLAGTDGRLARIGWSLDAFFQYPLFGAYGKEGIRIGNHSEVFDTLGRFGVVGAISLFSFIGLLFKDIYIRMKTRQGKKCCLICLVLYCIMAVLNPALYTQQLIPLFILLPLYERFCVEER